VARDKIVVKSGTSIYGYMRWGAYLNGPVCTTQAKLANTAVYNFRGYPDPILVATKSEGVAVLFKGPGGGHAEGQPHNRSVGGIATGGGLVRDTWGYYPLELEGVIDTSGTAPALAQCEQAKSDAMAASQTLAAMTPSQTLGRIDVDADGYYDIDAYGGGVINIEALRLEGRVLNVYYGYNEKYCDEDGAALYINANPGDQVILNVGQLKVGNCAYIEAPYNANVILNVPGPGKKIQVGIQADGIEFPILAPERVIVVKGAGDDTGTYLDLLWVNRAVIRGYASQYSFSPVPFCAAP
jgi:hypothetical protein